MAVRAGIFATALLAVPAPTYATPGQPDLAFGNGGSAVFDLGYPNGSPPMSRAMAAAFLPDGRMAVAGVRSGGGGSSQQLGLRLTATGALDPSFGGGTGWAATSEDRSGAPAAVFPDADGGMTIAGTGNPGNTPTTPLLRLLPSGQIAGS